MSKFDRNRIKNGWEKLCTNKQTNRQTNRHYENNGHLAVNQLLPHTEKNWEQNVRSSAFSFITLTRMRANAQRDGRPVEYRWRPVFNAAKFGWSPLAAEIGPVVWGTPANFNRFRILAVLLHGTPVVGISQTLWRWTEGATYIRQGSHHVGPHSSLFFYRAGALR